MNGITDPGHKYIKDKFLIPKKDDDTQLFKYDSTNSYYSILSQKPASKNKNYLIKEIVMEVKEETRKQTEPNKDKNETETEEKEKEKDNEKDNDKDNNDKDKDS